jgi:sporulation protein YlmC with PRC-barrel domain
MCGFIYKAGSDHSLKGKYIFSADGSNIGTVVSSFGNILIIEEKFKEEIGATQEIRKYEIPLIEIKKVEGPSIILKSKKEYIQDIYLKTKNNNCLFLYFYIIIVAVLD